MKFFFSINNLSCERFNNNVLILMDRTSNIEPHQSKVANPVIEDQDHIIYDVIPKVSFTFEDPERQRNLPVSVPMT
jgi:hypothetical protein